MKNKEKFMNELMDIVIECLAISTEDGRLKTCSKTKCDDCIFTNDCSNEMVKKWLEEEYKPKLLDKIEKKYFEGILKPFERCGLENIIIQKFTYLFSDPDSYVIRMFVHGKTNAIVLPSFNKKSEMYSGLEADKTYTAKELGLFE